MYVSCLLKTTDSRFVSRSHSKQTQRITHMNHSGPKLPTEVQRQRRAAYSRLYNAVHRADPKTRRRLLRAFWPKRCAA